MPWIRATRTRWSPPVPSPVRSGPPSPREDAPVMLRRPRSDRRFGMVHDEHGDGRFHVEVLDDRCLGRYPGGAWVDGHSVGVGPYRLRRCRRCGRRWCRNGGRRWCRGERRGGPRNPETGSGQDHRRTVRHQQVAATDGDLIGGGDRVGGRGSGRHGKGGEARVARRRVASGAGFVAQHIPPEHRPRRSRRSLGRTSARRGSACSRSFRQLVCVPRRSLRRRSRRESRASPRITTCSCRPVSGTPKRSTGG